MPNFISIRSGFNSVGSNLWLSHRKEISSLTHGLTYRSACDNLHMTPSSLWPVFKMLKCFIRLAKMWHHQQTSHNVLQSHIRCSVFDSHLNLFSSCISVVRLIHSHGPVMMYLCMNCTLLPFDLMYYYLHWISVC